MTAELLAKSFASTRGVLAQPADQLAAFMGRQL
jgi:hypothetical protein